jgi:heat-inducible transcriptional repressor
LRSVATKKYNKKQRELAVLQGLVDLYIKTGEPIGSNTLKENGFDYLSPATIRNYFSNLEKDGFVHQQHSSGGRIPTAKAYREYVNELGIKCPLKEKEILSIKEKLKYSTKEVAAYLHNAAEILSQETQMAIFLSAPRFDQDFIQDVKMISLDRYTILCVLITDFGLIRTESLKTHKELSSKDIQEIQDYFLYRLGKEKKPFFKDQSLAKLAQYFYNEIMVRHIVEYTHFQEEDLYRTGLSSLLHYPEFQDTSVLASSLSLLENPSQMRRLLQESVKINRLTAWIGNELNFCTPKISECSVIAIPYRINMITVGAFGLLGPLRMNYKKIFGLLNFASDLLSETLTKSVYKYKITFRKPEYNLDLQEKNFVHYGQSILLEDKRKGE